MALVNSEKDSLDNLTNVKYSEDVIVNHKEVER